MEDQNIERAYKSFEQARMNLLGPNPNYGLVLKHAMDAADLGHQEANYFLACIYFSAREIVQYDRESANKYAESYLRLSPDGPHVNQAKRIIDGSIGTENARRFIFSTTTNDIPTSSSSHPPGSSSPSILDENEKSSMNKKSIGFLVTIALFILSYFLYTKAQSNKVAPVPPTIKSSESTPQKDVSITIDGIEVTKDKNGTTNININDEPQLKLDLPENIVEIKSGVNGTQPVVKTTESSSRLKSTTTKTKDE